jgi:phage terminase large subunit-like protein
VGRHKLINAEQIRAGIVHPGLREAFDADWYWPLELTDEQRELPGVQAAIDEGWAEWIETEEDLEAIANGYIYDLSKDRKKRTIYWHRGIWVRYSGRRLVEVDESEVAYVGAGDHVCRFAELFLVHTKDPLCGNPYRFIHWQRKLMLATFGWVKWTPNEKGLNVRYRRYLEVMLEVAKKNAKSDLSSVVATILIRADNTTKAFVYGAASDRNQARIIFNEARDYVKQANQICDEIEVVDSKSKMVHWESGSTYEVISADAYRNDGYDAHGVLFDELHQQPSRALFSVMKRAGLARPQPLRFVTTTYGKSLSANTGKYTAGNIWAEEHQKTKAQLEGKRSNFRRLNMVASAEPIPVVVTQRGEIGDTQLRVYRLQQPIDAGEEIELEFSEAVGSQRSTLVRLTKPAKRYQRHIDIEPLTIEVPAYSEGEANREPLLAHRIDHAIRRANPSVGIVLSIDRIRSEILDAVGPQATAEAMQLCLNIVAGSGRNWISGAVWQACGRKKVLPSSLLRQRCFGGLDLSLTHDLTSFWLAFPNWKSGVKFGKVKDPLIRLAGLVWVPEEDIERREEIEEIPYRAYAEMKYIGKFGYVRLCKGSAIDYKQVGEDIVEFVKQFKLQAVAYDANYASLVVESYLQPAGIRCIPHRQGAMTMGPPTKRFENLIKHGHVQHGNHPLLNLAIEGCVLHTPDKVGNTFPSKEKSTKRIDPITAAIMACGWSCDPPVEARSSGAYSGEVGAGLFG